MPRLLIVMLGAFIAQTSEYLPIGLLPEIGSSLTVSEGSVGALVTGYAWVAALTAVPLTSATNALDRRSLFVGLLGVVSLANLIAALSPNYAVLAAVRVVTALTHGVFWSTLASFVIRVAPNMAVGRALAWAFGGISLATVVGVPAATAIGQGMGWRAAFGACAAFGLGVIATGCRGLPTVQADAGHSSPGFQRGQMCLYQAVIATGLMIAAHFCAYTYVAPLLERVAGMSNANVPTLLLAFGAAGAAGTLVVGWTGRRPAQFVLPAAVGIVGSQMLMATGMVSLAFAALDMMLWGFSIATLIIGLQGWVLEFVPERPDTGSALYVAAFNGGIGAGAMAGGLALYIDGELTVLWTGIVLGIIATGALAKLLGLKPLTH